MRTRRRRKINLRKCLATFVFSPLAIWLFYKIVPVLSTAAVFLAGITMPEGGFAVLSNKVKNNDTDKVCADTTLDIETQAQANEKAVVAPSDIGGATHSGTIAYKTFKAEGGTSYINLEYGQIRNCTTLSNEEVKLAASLLPEFKVEANGEPQVLIYHTHATESFEPYERNYFDSSYPTRTTDITKNMVAVGNAITEELEKMGIGVVHSETLHDAVSYTGSYDNSAETIKSVLAQYPSIKVVLDLHRDGIEANGVRTAPVINIDGQNAAQIMIISGCDDGTMDMPNCMQNLRLASLLQQQIESDYPGLTRAILFDYRKYNQDLSTGALLIEVGSQANTTEQAIYSGHLIGKSIGKALLK